MMVSLQEIDGTDSRIDPRNILKHQIDRLADIGYSPSLLAEMEFFLLSLNKIHLDVQFIRRLIGLAEGWPQGKHMDWK